MIRAGPTLLSLVQQALALFLEVFYDGTEVDRLVRELTVLGYFGLIQHFETVALKQLETASAIEDHHLGVDLFDAVVVEVAQIGLEKLTTDLD